MTDGNDELEIIVFVTGFDCACVIFVFSVLITGFKEDEITTGLLLFEAGLVGVTAVVDKTVLFAYVFDKFVTVAEGEGDEDSRILPVAFRVWKFRRFDIHRLYRRSENSKQRYGTPRKKKVFKHLRQAN